MARTEILTTKRDVIFNIEQIESVLFADLMYQHDNDRDLVKLIFEYKYAIYFKRIYIFLGRDE